MDIVVAVLLSIRNKKIVLARGRKPGGFIALTLALCFGLEITGALIGQLLGWVFEYCVLLGLGMLGIGALISYLVAKSCKPGDYYPVPPYMSMPPAGAPFAPPLGTLPSAQPLDEPATIDIIRETSMKGDLTSWAFILNGEKVGNLGNGAARSTATKQRQNTLRAVSEDGAEYMPLLFEIESSGHAEIHFKGDRFVREACTGILPMSAPPAPPVMPYAPPVILRTVPLAAPASIEILRDMDGEGADATWTFYLNHIPLGAVEAGQSVLAQSAQKQNVLRAVDSSGKEAEPLLFALQNGTPAKVYFRSGRFLPYRSTGLLLLSAQPAQPPYMPQYPPPYPPPYPPYAPMNVPPYMQPPPYAPMPPYMQQQPTMPPAGVAPAWTQPAPEPAEGTTCSKCGAPVRWSDQYCNRCGEKQPGAEQY